MHMSRGSPRSFGREQALRRAHDLFCSRGYQGVSVPELKRAVADGGASSFAATFGSKERLFREVWEFHARTHSACALQPFIEKSTARAAMHSMLRIAAQRYCQGGGPEPGCLIVLETAGVEPEHRGALHDVRGLRWQRRRIIRQRLEEGVRAGDLVTDADIAALEAFYTMILDGLILQARDGASRDQLLSIVDTAMTAWDTLARQGQEIHPARSGRWR